MTTRQRTRRCGWPARLAITALAAGAAAALTGGAAAEDAESPAPDVPDLAAGRRAYERCAICHRADGGGRADGTFPKIAGQPRVVVEAQLEAIREGRRPNPLMEPHAATLLDAQEVAAVAAYVASLPTPTATGRGPGDDLARGEQLYRADCVGCHGEGGESDAERLVPAVAGQHYAYLLRRARQLAGWRPAAHPEASDLLAAYTDAELRAVVDYASRLAGETAARAP